MIICMNFYDFGHLRSTGFFKIKYLCSAKSQTSFLWIQNFVLIGPKNAYVQLAAYADYKSAISIDRDALWNIRDSISNFEFVPLCNSQSFSIIFVKN